LVARVGADACGLNVDGLASNAGVEFHGDGDGGPPGIRLMYVVLLVPADPSVAVVSPGWLCLNWEVVRPFAWFCARSGFWDACGADGKMPGRCCAASV